MNKIKSNELTSEWIVALNGMERERERRKKNKTKLAAIYS